jgi:hypothetical protein
VNVVTIVVSTMASLRGLPNSPYWIACFTLPDGTRTQRSTKSADRREAQRIANKFEDASKEASSGRFIESQARKVMCKSWLSFRAFFRCNGFPLRRNRALHPQVKEQSGQHGKSGAKSPRPSRPR